MIFYSFSAFPCFSFLFKLTEYILLHSHHPATHCIFISASLEKKFNPFVEAAHPARFASLLQKSAEYDKYFFIFILLDISRIV